jgi:hypothetical protein
MRKEIRKRPNALKHGVFANMTILPWEDLRSFQRLHASLIEEWMPIGPTEHDAVLNIAKGLWRKRRMQHFLFSKMETCRVHRDHAAYDEAYVLRTLSANKGGPPDPGQFEAAPSYLSAENEAHLRQKFPRRNFQSASEWVRAVQGEIKSVLLPKAERGNELTETLLFRSVAFFTEEVVKQELAVEDRIDAMIDRAMKRLMQAKAMKEILSRASPNGGHDQPKKSQVASPTG